MATWIKRKILPEILTAIRTTDRSTYVFYITGKLPRQGGNGKTILLRQIGQELGSPDGIDACFPWSGILDLYHSDVNSNSGLESLLSVAFETKKGEFEPYHIMRDKFTLRREAGLFAQELEKERRDLTEEFTRCLTQVTDEHRVVIALDTTERIQYEMDQVQQQCGIKDESTTVKAWLVEQLPRWQNCVVLLVGRAEDKPFLKRALENALVGKPGIHYEHKILGGFDKDEAAEYFKAKESEYPAIREVDTATRRKFLEVTEGQPIRLELLLYVLQYQPGSDTFRKQTEALSPQEAREEIDRLLIEQVMSGEPDSTLRDILGYLAIARKGIDADLLHYLSGEGDIESCQKKLDALADRSFIKSRSGEKRIFLHDEMYDLCDQHLFLKDPTRIRKQSKRIVESYDARIEDLKQQAEAETNDERRRALNRARGNLEIDSLLYRLRADPREGYGWYTKEAATAIRSVEVGFDMRLRDELFAFLKSSSRVDQKLLEEVKGLEEEINYDEAARWVLRLTRRGQLGEAIRVSEVLLADPERTWTDPRFQLAHAELKLYYAEALMYNGRAQEAVDLLKATIVDLERDVKPAKLAQQDPRSPTGWRRNLILGRAHNDLAYAYGFYLNHYRMALDGFESASPYFRASDIKEEMANTVDNMARIYGQLYHRGYAMALVDDGYVLRQKMGREYRVALSLNSKAIICLIFRQPDLGRHLSIKALRIAEQLGVQRGIGLASLTLGHALRLLGGQWEDGVDSSDCEELLSNALAALKRAEEIFKPEGVNEPLHLIEVYNELGCTYRDQAALARSTGHRTLGRVSMDDAIRYLTLSVEKAKEYHMPVLESDAHEDLAQTYFENGDFGKASGVLDRGEGSVDNRYKIQKNTGLQEIPKEQCVEEFWQMLGKIELLRGHIIHDSAPNDAGRVLDREKLRDAIKHYAFAAAYFERYSSSALRSEPTNRQLHKRFKNYRMSELQFIREDALPSLASEYHLDLRRLIDFFEDTLLPF